MIYVILVILLGVGSFAPVPMIRALKSKLTNATDQGKAMRHDLCLILTFDDDAGALFAAAAAVETFCGLLGSMVFNPIYSATVSSFKGAVFCTMGAFEFGGLIIVM
jgi:hypothetical protein